MSIARPLLLSVPLIALLACDPVHHPVEARGDYVRVHGGGRMDVIRAPISQLEARLDPKRFVRVHRSAIVNLTWVREIRAPVFGGSVAILHSGQQCPLSRTGRQRLGQVLGQPI